MSKGGRPSKLSDERWNDLLGRLAGGAKASDLAKVFKISEAAISRRVSKPAETVKSLATELVQVQTRIDQLPDSQARLVQHLADQMRALGTATMNVATLNAQSAELVATKGLAAAKALPAKPEPEDYRPVVAAAETSNKLLAPALAVLNAKGIDGTTGLRPKTHEQILEESWP